MSRVDFGKFVKNKLAGLVSFTNLGTDIVSTNVQGALAELAGRHFGKNFADARQNPNFQEINGIFEDALVINIPNAPAGTYLGFHSYRANNSKSNTSNQTEVRFQDLATVTNTVVGQSPLGGGLGEQFCGFTTFTTLATPNLKFSLAIARTAGNGAARINTMNLAIWRIF